MWAPIAALSHWINSGDVASFMGMDDGYRACKLIGLIGCAVMTMLKSIDVAGELKADSSVRDLGLVLSLYLKYARGL